MKKQKERKILQKKGLCFMCKKYIMSKKDLLDHKITLYTKDKNSSFSRFFSLKKREQKKKKVEEKERKNQFIHYKIIYPIVFAQPLILMLFGKLKIELHLNQLEISLVQSFQDGPSG